MGTSAESVPWAIQVPIQVGGVEVKPGDIVFCDPVEGAVVIPQELIEDVVRFLPEHLKSEETIKSAVKGGMSVSEAFRKFR